MRVIRFSKKSPPHVCNLQSDGFIKKILWECDHGVQGLKKNVSRVDDVYDSYVNEFASRTFHKPSLQLALYRWSWKYIKILGQ